MPLSVTETGEEGVVVWVMSCFLKVTVAHLKSRTRTINGRACRWVWLVDSVVNDGNACVRLPTGWTSGSVSYNLPSQHPTPPHHFQSARSSAYSKPNLKEALNLQKKERKHTQKTHCSHSCFLIWFCCFSIKWSDRFYKSLYLSDSNLGLVLPASKIHIDKLVNYPKLNITSA